MIGARYFCVLSLLVMALGCGSSFGSARGEARLVQRDRFRVSEDESLLSLRLSRETSVPISGARIVVDGQPLDIELTQASVELELSPGEHQLELDLLLMRGGPRVYSRGPAYEARIQGRTRFEVARGCRLTLSVAAREPVMFDVRPELSFRHALSCRSSDGPIPEMGSVEPFPGNMDLDDFQSWGERARQQIGETTGFVELASHVALRNEDEDQARCLDESIAAFRRTETDLTELIEGPALSHDHELHHLASRLRHVSERARALENQARSCL